MVNETKVEPVVTSKKDEFGASRATAVAIPPSDQRKANGRDGLSKSSSPPRKKRPKAPVGIISTDAPVVSKPKSLSALGELYLLRPASPTRVDTPSDEASRNSNSSNNVSGNSRPSSASSLERGPSPSNKSNSDESEVSVVGVSSMSAAVAAASDVSQPVQLIESKYDLPQVPVAEDQPNQPQDVASSIPAAVAAAQPQQQPVVLVNADQQELQQELQQESKYGAGAAKAAQSQQLQVDASLSLFDIAEQTSRQLEKKHESIEGAAGASQQAQPSAVLENKTEDEQAKLRRYWETVLKDKGKAVKTRIAEEEKLVAQRKKIAAGVARDQTTLDAAKKAEARILRYCAAVAADRNDQNANRAKWYEVWLLSQAKNTRVENLPEEKKQLYATRLQQARSALNKINVPFVEKTDVRASLGGVIPFSVRDIEDLWGEGKDYFIMQVSCGGKWIENINQAKNFIALAAAVADKATVPADLESIYEQRVKLLVARFPKLENELDVILLQYKYKLSKGENVDVVGLVTKEANAAIKKTKPDELLQAVGVTRALQRHYVAHFEALRDKLKKDVQVVEGQIQNEKTAAAQQVQAKPVNHVSARGIAAGRDQDNSTLNKLCQAKRDKEAELSKVTETLQMLSTVSLAMVKHILAHPQVLVEACSSADEYGYLIWSTIQNADIEILRKALDQKVVSEILKKLKEPDYTKNLRIEKSKRAAVHFLLFTDLQICKNVFQCLVKDKELSRDFWNMFGSYTQGVVNGKDADGKDTGKLKGYLEFALETYANENPGKQLLTPEEITAWLGANRAKYSNDDFHEMAQSLYSNSGVPVEYLVNLGKAKLDEGAKDSQHLFAIFRALMTRAPEKLLKLYEHNKSPLLANFYVDKADKAKNAMPQQIAVLKTIVALDHANAKRYSEAVKVFQELSANKYLGEVSNLQLNQNKLWSWELTADLLLGSEDVEAWSLVLYWPDIFGKLSEARFAELFQKAQPNIKVAALHLIGREIYQSISKLDELNHQQTADPAKKAGVSNQLKKILRLRNAIPLEVWESTIKEAADSNDPVVCGNLWVAILNLLSLQPSVPAKLSFDSAVKKIVINDDGVRKNIANFTKATIEYRSSVANEICQRVISHLDGLEVKNKQNDEQLLRGKKAFVDKLRKEGFVDKLLNAFAGFENVHEEDVREEKIERLLNHMHINGSTIDPKDRDFYELVHAIPNEKRNNPEELVGLFIKMCELLYPQTKDKREQKSQSTEDIFCQEFFDLIQSVGWFSANNATIERLNVRAHSPRAETLTVQEEEQLEMGQCARTAQENQARRTRDRQITIEFCVGALLNSSLVPEKTQTQTQSLPEQKHARTPSVPESKKIEPREVKAYVERLVAHSAFEELATKVANQLAAGLRLQAIFTIFLQSNYGVDKTSRSLNLDKFYNCLSAEKQRIFAEWIGKNVSEEWVKEDAREIALGGAGYLVKKQIVAEAGSETIKKLVQNLQNSSPDPDLARAIITTPKAAENLSQNDFNFLATQVKPSPALFTEIFDAIMLCVNEQTKKNTATLFYVFVRFISEKGIGQEKTLAAAFIKTLDSKQDFKKLLPAQAIDRIDIQIKNGLITAKQFYEAISTNKHGTVLLKSLDDLDNWITIGKKTPNPLATISARELVKAYADANKADLATQIKDLNTRKKILLFLLRSTHVELDLTVEELAKVFDDVKDIQYQAELRVMNVNMGVSINTATFSSRVSRIKDQVWLKLCQPGGLPTLRSLFADNQQNELKNKASERLKSFFSNEENRTAFVHGLNNYSHLKIQEVLQFLKDNKLIDFKLLAAAVKKANANVHANENAELTGLGIFLLLDEKDYSLVLEQDGSLKTKVCVKNPDVVQYLAKNRSAIVDSLETEQKHPQPQQAAQPVAAISVNNKQINCRRSFRELPKQFIDHVAKPQQATPVAVVDLPGMANAEYKELKSQQRVIHQQAAMIQLQPVEPAALTINNIIDGWDKYAGWWNDDLCLEFYRALLKDHLNILQARNQMSAVLDAAIKLRLKPSEIEVLYNKEEANQESILKVVFRNKEQLKTTAETDPDSENKNKELRIRGTLLECYYKDDVPRQLLGIDLGNNAAAYTVVKELLAKPKALRKIVSLAYQKNSDAEFSGEEKTLISANARRVIFGRADGKRPDENKEAKVAECGFGCHILDDKDWTKALYNLATNLKEDKDDIAACRQIVDALKSNPFLNAEKRRILVDGLERVCIRAERKSKKGLLGDFWHAVYKSNDWIEEGISQDSWWWKLTANSGRRVFSEIANEEQAQMTSNRGALNKLSKGQSAEEKAVAHDKGPMPATHSHPAHSKSIGFKASHPVVAKQDEDFTVRVAAWSAFRK